MPVVSDGGRTYTFRIRPGFRFSPPSNEPVTAADLQVLDRARALAEARARRRPASTLIERHRRRGRVPRGKARHVSGIVARGDTLTIRLVAPAGDFLARLSMPFFAAVPIGTPIVSGGVQTPIPSAGPYYIKLAWQDERARPRAQPELPRLAPAPARADRLRHRQQSPTGRRSDRERRADYAADVLQESTFAAGSALDARFGGALRAPGRHRGSCSTPQTAFRLHPVQHGARSVRRSSPPPRRELRDRPPRARGRRRRAADGVVRAARHSRSDARPSTRSRRSRRAHERSRTASTAGSSSTPAPGRTARRRRRSCAPTSHPPGSP